MSYYYNGKRKRTLFSPAARSPLFSLLSSCVVLLLCSKTRKLPTLLCMHPTPPPTQAVHAVNLCRRGGIKVNSMEWCTFCFSTAREEEPPWSGMILHFQSHLTFLPLISSHSRLTLFFPSLFEFYNWSSPTRVVIDKETQTDTNPGLPIFTCLLKWLF